MLPKRLVLENFHGHLVECVRDKLKELCMDIAVIPGGLTAVLQPFNVSLNRPFKDNVGDEDGAALCVLVC